MKKYYEIAQCLFSINALDSIGEGLQDYFSSVESCDDKKKDTILDIIFLSIGDKLQFDVEKNALQGKIKFNKKGFYINNSCYEYYVENLFDKDQKTILYIKAKKAKIFSKKWFFDLPLLNLFFNEHGFQNSMLKAMTNYTCLWYIFAMCFLKNNIAFVHCGMCGNDEGGIVLTGAGACGKTSTLTDLISNHNYKFMAEDFGLVDSTGYCHYMEKKGTIYSSDAQYGNSYLNNAINRMRFINKLEWKVKKNIGKDPSYQFSPQELFGNNICKKTKLDKMIILTRTNIDEPRYKEVDKDVFCYRVEEAAFRELKELFEILTNIRAVGGRDYFNSFPDIHELQRNYLEIIYQALDKTDFFEIEVPFKASPSDTVKIVLKS